MSIDPYALCPCGSGKKIKFCCKDLAGEIEKIERMLEADQRHACLEHVQQLEKKYPGRSYLETTKADLLRSLGRSDEADDALQHTLQRDADNPVALAESALLQLGRKDQSAADALDTLQRAIARTEGHLPERVLEAVATLSNHLYAEGYLPACLAHMHLYLAVAPEDEGAQRAMTEFYESSYVPLVFKEDWRWRPCPDDAPWKPQFDEATKLSNRAAWAAAEAKLTELPPEAHKNPAVLRNLAVMRAWNADHELAAEALRQLAQLEDLPLGDAVEAELLAQQLDVEEPDETIDVLRVTWEICDMDALTASLSADKRLINFPVRGDYGDEPKPRAQYLLLDRPEPETGVGITAEQLPRVMGELLVFGRQTDRQARVELTIVDDENLADSKQAVAGILGSAADGQEQQEVIDQDRAAAHKLRNDWWFPRDTPHDTRQGLTFQRRRDTLLNAWIKVPFQTLDGKTPEEAAGDPQYKVPLLALILATQIASQREHVTSFDFNELRARLNLQPSEPIDPTGLDLRDVPAVRLAELDASKLSEDDLRRMFQRAMLLGAVEASYRLGQELVSRADVDPETPLYEVYTLLAQRSEDTRKALEYADLARQSAEQAGHSSANWDILELTIRIRRHEGDDVQRLFEHISREHINEPGVQQTLASLLMEMGVVNPDGSSAGDEEPPGLVGSQTASGGESKIWTPESESGGGGGAIWTPD